MRLWLCLVLILLPACVDGEKPEDTALPVDRDGDGWTHDEGDCDDADPGVHPGVDESCFENDDPACDGVAGCESLDPQFAVTDVWDNGYDDWAYTVVLTDLDGDGYHDAIVENVHSASTLGDSVLLGRSTRDGWRDEDSHSISFEGGFFCSVGIPAASPPSDLDGDGTEDLIDSVLECDPDTEWNSEVWVVSGAEVLAGESTDWTSNIALVTSLQPYPQMWSRIMAAHDLEGEGLLLTGTDTDDARIALFPWSSFAAGPQEITAAPALLTGADAGVVLPDADGDGLADLALCVDDTAYLLSGVDVWSSVEARATAASADVAGASAAFSEACAVWVVGDVDDDGLADLLVGLGGRFDGGSLLYANMAAGPTFVSDVSVCPSGPVGDLDGDGRDELGFDACKSASDLADDTTWLLTGAHVAGGGTLDVVDDQDATWQEAGNPHGGDVDGDGFDDLLLNREGSLEVFFGPI